MVVVGEEVGVGGGLCHSLVAPRLGVRGESSKEARVTGQKESGWGVAVGGWGQGK